MTSGSRVDERASVLLQLGAIVALVLGVIARIDQPRGTSIADRLGLMSGGANPTIALLIFVAVLVIVLSPGGTIGRTGQRALRLAVGLGGLTFVGSILGAGSLVSHGSTLQLWLVFVVPRLMAVVPAGLAVRFAVDALRGA